MLPAMPDQSRVTGSGRTAGEIQREVLSEAIQHPATIYPIGLAVAAGIYTVTMSGFFGGTVPAGAVTAIASLAAIASFGWRYFVRGEAEAVRKARGVVEAAAREEERAEQEHLARLEAKLARCAPHPALTEAARLLTDLRVQHDGVTAALAGPDLAQTPYALRIQPILRETFAQALSLLDDVVETIQASAGIDRAAIEKDIAATTREIARLPRDQRYESRAAIKQQYIASQRARLEACTEQEVKVEKLLAQATACLAAIERVHLEVPTLDSDQRERTTDQAAERLLRTVERARLARKRLSGVDDEAAQAEDEAYERRGTEHI